MLRVAQLQIQKPENPVRRASRKLGIYATPYVCFIVSCQRQCTLFTFFHISMRSGSWNLCSGEGGQSLIIGVCECDTIL